ncbi:MAG: hypothetical protein FWF92_03685 [Oscillospiraceae bacterium]|nr:hypothetical protein [Oscillospiraceae bacterium]
MKELPARKSIRLKGYDYSNAGYYFLTMCVEDGHEMLGTVVVGDGVLDVPFVELSEYGIIAEKRICAIDDHYEHISIQNYVVMPNHIHILLAVLIDRETETNIKCNGRRGRRPLQMRLYRRLFLH